MDGSFRPKGSFGIPENIQKQMEQARTRAEAPPKPAIGGATVPPSEQAPTAEQPVVPTAEPKSEDDEKLFAEQKKLLPVKLGYETSLGIKIEEEDIRHYIFKGRLSKPVTIVSKYMKGIVQTLTTAESSKIDEKLADIQLTMKKTAQGFENERAILVLSYAWTHAENHGTMRSLGETAEDREKTIREMGTHVVDQAAEANVGLNFLLKYALREPGFLKK